MKKIVNLIVDKGLDPCIVFSFSKRECESFASALKNCDYNNDDEKQSIEAIYKNAIGTLSEED
jgi:ATP-dependent RNA helicase DOB1